MNFILTLGEVTVKLLDLELQEVSDWFGLGLHLDIPSPELYNIKHNITLRSPQEFRMEVFSVWMKKLPEPTWPRVVKALMEIGRERLAHKIALKSMSCKFTGSYRKLGSELNTQFGMNCTLCILQFLMSIHVFCYYTSVRVLCYYVPYISRHVHSWIFNIAVGVLSAAKVCKRRFC